MAALQSHWQVAMMYSRLCCDQCFADIAKRSTNAARLWLDLCECCQEADLLVLSGYDTPEIRVLENLGYLLSTETADEILIQMNGLMETQEGSHFCCWEEKHG